MQNKLEIVIQEVAERALERAFERVLENKTSAPIPMKALQENPLTIDEVCGRLNISRSTFHNLVNTGRLRAYKLGGRTFVKAKDLENSFQEIKSRKYKQR